MSKPLMIIPKADEEKLKQIQEAVKQLATETKSSVLGEFLYDVIYVKIHKALKDSVVV